MMIHIASAEVGKTNFAGHEKGIRLLASTFWGKGEREGEGSARR